MNPVSNPQPLLNGNRLGQGLGVGRFTAFQEEVALGLQQQAPIVSTVVAGVQAADDLDARIVFGQLAINGP